METPTAKTPAFLGVKFEAFWRAFRVGAWVKRDESNVVLGGGVHGGFMLVPSGFGGLYPAVLERVGMETPVHCTFSSK